MLLKSIKRCAIPQVAYATDSPTVECESCGKKGPSHLMINLMIGIGSPGHPSLAAMQCPGSGQIENRPEHWACTPECWQKIAHACIDEHMHVLLQEAHQKLDYGIKKFGRKL